MQSSAKVTLWKEITAVESRPAPDRERRGGLLVPLPEGTELTVCGEGFSERTVTVECQGCFYVVFRQDIDSPDSCDVA